MCDYCDLGNYVEHYWKDDVLMQVIDDFGYTQLRLEYNNKTKQFSIVAIGEDEVKLDISHCLMCGRKLCD